MSGWRNRIVGEGMADAKALTAHPANFRRHGDLQRAALDGSLAELGWVQRVVVNRTSGRIIDGHLRVDMAAAAGEQVPVVYVELSDAEERLALASLDPIAGLAENDQEALDHLLEDLDVGHDGLRAFLDGLASEEPDTPAAGLTDPDEIPDTPSKATTTQGELIELGDHRLYCGDSTDPVTVEMVLDGQPADLVWTDPPYNIAYEDVRGRTIANDAMGSKAFGDFLRRAFTAMAKHLRPGAPAYVAYADSEVVNVRLAYADAGLLPRQSLVWVKSSFTLGRQDYHWQHECILYGWKAGAAHTWVGGYDKATVVDDEPNTASMPKDALRALVQQLRNARNTSVIREPKPSANDLHPTMKPVGLIAHMVANSSARGASVLDPFGGSGSTLIACEQLGRSARLIELDPRYCDVIVARWEAFTGRNAVRTARASRRKRSDSPTSGNRQHRRATVKRRSKAA